jgi:hypothetical protein
VKNLYGSSHLTDVKKNNIVTTRTRMREEEEEDETLQYDFIVFWLYY